jgi:hypothetical protein
MSGHQLYIIKLLDSNNTLTTDYYTQKLRPRIIKKIVV